MAGGFDKNKDYAAAIKNEKDPGKRNQLISERQNKLNWMNSTGRNKGGYTNSIYGSKYSTISEKGGSSGGGGWGGYSEPDYAATAAEAKRQAGYATTVAYQNAAQVKLNNAGLEKSMKATNDTYSGFNKATVDNTRDESSVNAAAAFGYFDPNKDYAADIAREKDPNKRSQLMQERNNKINWLNASGKNKWGQITVFTAVNTAPSKKNRMHLLYRTNIRPIIRTIHRDGLWIVWEKVPEPT